MNFQEPRANLFCDTDNAVSLEGAKLLVSYLEEFAKANMA
jgi:hypothetical protein